MGDTPPDTPAKKTGPVRRTGAPGAPRAAMRTAALVPADGTVISCHGRGAMGGGVAEIGLNTAGTG